MLKPRAEFDASVLNSRNDFAVRGREASHSTQSNSNAIVRISRYEGIIVFNLQLVIVNSLEACAQDEAGIEAVPIIRYHFTMLNLHASTAPRWLSQVAAHLDELLIDHAHCEKKAAGVAMNLLFAYVDRLELVRALSIIVQEELSHFHLVLDLLERRAIRFRKIPPSTYGQRLHQIANKLEPLRAVDRLLIAGLIEARSCERFGLLRDHLPDPELAGFFGSLFESEARHHSIYIRLAKLFAPEETVMRRLEELAIEEARIIAEGGELPRMHS